VVGRQNADITDILHLRDVTMATIFWLSVYGVHIGVTWLIRLNVYVRRQCGLMSRVDNEVDYAMNLYINLVRSSSIAQHKVNSQHGLHSTLYLTWSC